MSKGSRPPKSKNSPIKPAKKPVQKDLSPDDKLIEDMGSFSQDPYAWVLYSFDWGKGELEGFEGPDEWQTEILKAVRDKIITISEAIQIAIASGHGIGKSALVAWLILWSLSTFEDTKGIVTANTETQLKTKTWAELSKWYRLFIAKHWFTLTATAIYSVEPEHEKTWRFDMVAWSEHKTEAFAGMHNKGKRIVIIFDEASAIPNIIWEVTEGALTDADTEIMWFVFGNPTRNTGRFFDCFNKLRHRWLNKQIDSRTVKITNKEQIQKWVDDLGLDSDFVRVRVRGLFPKASDHQFIPWNYVEDAVASKRKLTQQSYYFAPKILTLDNAWMGGSAVVIGMRQGLNFRIMATFPKNDDDFIIAGHLARIEDEEKADAVFIDLGYGTGVYSAGKQMGRHWRLIPFGGGSPDPGYLNLRVYMWLKMKEWLRDGGQIPDDPILCGDITGPEAYEVTSGKNIGKIYLESKEDMLKRGLASPNHADCLALSFAEPVQPKTLRQQYHEVQKTYDPLSFQEAMKPKPRQYNPLGSVKDLTPLRLAA